MNLIILILVPSIFSSQVSSYLPSLYEYYIENGKTYSGLSANGEQFILNNKSFVIYSGSLHYFRIVPQYWQQTLAKFKAAGLNTVQFYIPWNRHEPRPGEFDFQSFGLNLTQFLMDIKSADMFAIVRPGPYICAEWEFGGLPPWLLKDPNMLIRSEYPGFIEPVRRYFSKVFQILNRFQFSQNGGPIIALQIENEYFSEPFEKHSLNYLQRLHQIITKENNFTELLFTSDPAFMAITVPVRSLGIMETANLNQNSEKMLMELRRNQPGKPVYVSEFWPGWFDSWGEHFHHHYATWLFEQQISQILFKVNASVNFYMFIGGTNFGFYNGARVVTSYDYDAPLSENGNYTEKYWKTRELYKKLVVSGRHPEIYLPPSPPLVPKAKNYGSILIKEYLPLDKMLQLMKPIERKQVIFMEYLDNSSGFGYILYRIQTKPINILNITGPIYDRAIIMINGKTIARINDGSKMFQIHINSSWFPIRDVDYIIDILVENLGRLNWGNQMMNKQRKGINSPIFLDQKEFQKFKIYTFDLNEKFLNSLNHLRWYPFDSKFNSSPQLYRTNFKIDNEIGDTFLKLPEWTFGNVFVNDFNIGRYNHLGPQRTLYIPGPLLRSGSNMIHVFELGTSGFNLTFLDYMD